MIKGVLLDLSGTIYTGDQLIPGAREAVEQLQAEKIPLRYLTNSSRSPRRAIHQKLRDFGLVIDEATVFTAPQAVRDYLIAEELTPHLLVHPAIEEEFADLTGPAPDAVVLGDAADAFSYANLNRAFRLLLDGAPLLAVGDNRYFREEEGMSLDVGPFVAALEYAAGCQALILGKPAREFFLDAAGQLGCPPGEVLMVGDDVSGDVNGALAAGLQAALVQTGKYQPGDEEQCDADAALLFSDLRQLVQELF